MQPNMLLPRIMAGGVALAEFAGLHPGIGTGCDEAFIVPDALRKQLVIYDPACAPLLRLVLRSGDLHPWYIASEGHWLIAIPAGWTVQHYGAGLSEAEAWQRFTQQHQSLAWHLEPFATVARQRPNQGDFWWELDPASTLTVFSPPKICWPTIAPRPCFSWDETPHLVGSGALCLPNATPYLLGVLASRVAWFVLQAALPPSQLPIPHPPEADQHAIGSLAQAISTEAAARYTLHCQVRRRLLADLGPPGAHLDSTLYAWWQLDFADLRAALVRVFKNDIPQRYQPDWEQWFSEQRRAHAQHTTAIIESETELNERVAACFALTPADVALINAQTAYAYGEP